MTKAAVKASERRLGASLALARIESVAELLSCGRSSGSAFASSVLGECHKKHAKIYHEWSPLHSFSMVATLETEEDAMDPQPPIDASALLGTTAAVTGLFWMLRVRIVG